MAELLIHKHEHAPDSQIVVMKLMTTQEIICKLQQRTPTGYHVKDVREIAPQQRPGGGWVLTLAPYFVSLMDYKESVVINDHAVVSVLHNIPQELEREYLSAVSGITIAKAVL